ncbi:hypothetical protein L3X38_007228 [Prunus dulcis]|uniref:Uncharacterized protein n=1 Tax=Prunus dulcis TaxID=3755 RepID=A0AAD5F5X5_PRUDU|nr:hypothetical protein L3X38_007228 [Prunus dulcis]
MTTLTATIRGKKQIFKQTKRSRKEEDKSQLVGQKQIFKQRKRNRKEEDKSQVARHSSGAEIRRIKKDGNLGDGNSHRRVRVSGVVGLYDYVYTLYLAKNS